MNCVFAFGGCSKSGKTTLGHMFARELGVGFASFGDYVRKEATRRGLTNPSHGDVQEVGLSLVATDLRRFCELVLADSGFVPGQGLVIDGIRHLDTVRVLKTLVSPQLLKVVYLENSLADRLKRSSLTSEELEKRDSHPVEAETAAIKHIADLVLDTSAPMEDSFARLCGWALQNCS
jgi:hypothetical protein